MTQGQTPQRYLEFEDVRLDVEFRQLFVRDQEVALRPKAMELLLLLASRSEQLVTREQIMASVWRNAVVTNDSITQCIIEIRRALGDRDHTLVKTLPKRGYIFSVQVRSRTSTRSDERAPGIATDDARAPQQEFKARRTMLAAACSLFLVAVFALLSLSNVNVRHGSSSAVPNSVAVLPFTALNSDREHVRLGPRLGQELIHRLTNEPKLRVIASSSSLGAIPEADSLADIARSLNVTYLLTGSVYTSGDDVHVAAQLVEASTGRYVWSGTFDRELGDVQAVQSNIAAAVVVALTEAVRLADTDSARLAWQPEAQRAYLRGRFYLSRRDAGDTRKALREFEAALAADPNQALAWAGVASAVRLMVGEGDLPREAGLERMREASQHALSIDPSLVEAHVRLANYWYLVGDSQGSSDQLRIAFKISPNDALLLSVMAGNAVYDGDIKSALELQKRVVALDPLSANQSQNLAFYYWRAGLLEAARKQYLEVLELWPTRRDVIHVELAKIALLQGRAIRALELIAEVPGESAHAIRAMAHWKINDTVASQSALDMLFDANSGTLDWKIEVVETLVQRQDVPAALVWMGELVAAIERGDYSFEEVCEAAVRIEQSPFLEPLAGNSEWREVLGRLVTARDEQQPQASEGRLSAL